MGYKRKILEARKLNRDRKKHLPKDVDYRAAKRQCLKKLGYASEKYAKLKIDEIAEEGRKNLRYYQCPICTLWHLSSHSKGNQKFVS